MDFFMLTFIILNNENIIINTKIIIIIKKNIIHGTMGDPLLHSPVNYYAIFTD